MTRRKVEKWKVPMGASVWPETKDYFKTHDEKPGEVLDNYVKDKI